MIFTILTLIFLIFFFILGIPAGLIHLILKLLKLEKAADVFALRYVQFGLRGTRFFSGIKLTVIGRENIPTDQAVLYIGNHKSIFDVVVTYGIIPNLTGFVSKISMKKAFPISFWMNRTHCLFMDRDDLKQSLQVILTAIEKIKNGVSIFIYPEGTRNKTEDLLLPFHAGSFKPAERTKCTVIPVAVSYDKPVFEEHIPFLKRTHVILEFGAPIATKEYERAEFKALPKQTENVISEMLIKHQEILNK